MALKCHFSVSFNSKWMWKIFTDVEILRLVIKKYGVSYGCDGVLCSIEKVLLREFLSRKMAK